MLLRPVTPTCCTSDTDHQNHIIKVELSYAFQISYLSQQIRDFQRKIKLNVLEHDDKYFGGA